ncbi:MULTISPECIES: DNA primase [Campylobacter]|uniref:DNA primase n=1 Tax=Campylobacter curvus (strain 525.92) TaxID=360105 RepID=A7H183_CAMC5|nr:MULTISPECIES: DNA primase [Campylobacter]EAU00898.1 DNA primase [Campylobacter curvus 525.92]EJP76063.1 DNA primase [Campylobacter sp. FOBRC14]
MIEPKSIQKLKDQIDIVDIISHYIPVRKMGANFKCVCPFHDDRNPSMSISQSKQIFHCFACKAGGDAIKFVMDYEKLNYVEAIEKIAQISNFSLEYTSERNFAPKENKHILENVNAFYRSAFYKNDEAVRYIYSRGINDAMIERFELGWAGDSAQTIRLLENEKIEPSEALEVGIVKQNERGIYASFISRITFPIYNHTGRLVGFGGRTISNNPAKYVNSPQSAVFDKSKLLYGYHLAKQKIFEKKQIIITEGYLDVIMLHFAGFTNAVAVLGTALTEKHLPLLKRDDISVVLCFDGDVAGINAAIKSSHLLSLNEIDGSVVIIAGGADPADMVFAGRIKELEELFASGVELGEFYIRQIAKNYDLTRPVQKQKCLEEIETYTKNLKNIVASSYAPLVASLLGIDMNSFSLGGARAQNPQPNSQNFINRPIARTQKDILEISILKSMLFNENFAAIVLDTIDEKYFLHHKEGFRAILSNSSESDEILLREIELDESAMVIGDEKKLLSAIANLKIKFYENLQLHIRSSSDSDKIEKLQKIAAIINNLKFQIRNS